MSLISNNLRKESCFHHFLFFYEIRWQHVLVRSKVDFMKKKVKENVEIKEEQSMNKVISCWCREEFTKITFKRPRVPNIKLLHNVGGGSWRHWYKWNTSITVLSSWELYLYLKPCGLHSESKKALSVLVFKPVFGSYHFTSTEAVSGRHSDLHLR